MTFKKYHLSDGLMGRWMNKCFDGTPETARERRALPFYLRINPAPVNNTR
jgi:hypothetical protein